MTEDRDRIHVLWAPAWCFLPHVIEELVGGFPSWATRHFGTTTLTWFLVSHVSLVAGAVAIPWLATRARSPRWVFLVAVAQWTLFANAVFHAVTTIAFREYSPGLVTALVLVVPSTLYLARSISGRGWLAPRSHGLAVACGAVLGALVVASLYLDMDW